MEVTRTIKLTEEEIKIIQDYLQLVDSICDEVQTVSMSDISNYFLEHYDYSDNHKPYNLIQIEDIER